MPDRLGHVAEWRAPGSMIASPGISTAPSAASDRAGLKLQLGAIDNPRVGGAVAVRMGGDAIQHFDLLGRPCNHQRSGFEQRQVHPVMDAAIEAKAVVEDAQLLAALRLIVSGVEQRTVALAGAFENVPTLFQHQR